MKNAQSVENAPDIAGQSIPNERTQFSVVINTLPGGKMPYNGYEISKHSKLLAVFQALKEGNMESLRDLVPNEPLPSDFEQDGTLV